MKSSLIHLSGLLSSFEKLIIDLAEKQANERPWKDSTETNIANSAVGDALEATGNFRQLLHDFSASACRVKQQFNQNAASWNTSSTMHHKISSHVQTFHIITNSSSERL